MKTDTDRRPEITGLSYIAAHGRHDHALIVFTNDRQKKASTEVEARGSQHIRFARCVVCA